ncbi:MAG: hypothetical protein EON54_01145 [Alcaligenaceae bacterium]|nr:MAG: hypothetical protein EON54_01145 [Alcaligenaceae bacterium]
MNHFSKKSLIASNLALITILSGCGGSGGVEEAASTRVELTESNEAASSSEIDIKESAEQNIAEVSKSSGISVPATPRLLNAFANRDGTVTLAWERGEENGGVDSFNIWRDGHPLHSINSSNAAYVDSGLASDTQYTYQISATDKNGNTSPLSAKRSTTTLVSQGSGDRESISNEPITMRVSTSSATKAGEMTKAVRDLLAPTSPTDLVISARGASSLMLTWKESSDNVSVAGYNVYKNSTWVGGTTGREFTFNSLAAGVQYDLAVKAYDDAGNHSPAARVVATPGGAAAAADVTAPTAPSGLTTGAVSSSSIALRWNASTDAAGVAGYELYLDGVLIGDLTRQLSYTFNGLAPSTRYKFSVKAFDAAGNKSQLSTPLIAKTNAAPAALTAKRIANNVVIEGKNPWTENPMMFWDDVNAAFEASGLPLGAEVPVGPGKLYRAGTPPARPESPELKTTRFKYQRTSDTRSGEAGVVYTGVGPKPILSYPEYNGPARTFNKMYVSWWYKPSISPGAEGASNKFVRFWDEGNGKGTRVSWTQMHLTCTVPVDYKPEVSWGNWWENGGIVGKWNRHEVELDLSVPRVRNWVNGVAGHNHPCVKDPAYSENPIALALIGFDHGGGKNGYDYLTMKTSIDDIYISNSPARVELSDSPTWSGAGQREVLPVKNWSPTKIELGEVRGVLKATTQLYAYVVAPNGSVNAAGIPLK